MYTNWHTSIAEYCRVIKKSLGRQWCMWQLCGRSELRPLLSSVLDLQDEKAGLSCDWWSPSCASAYRQNTKHIRWCFWIMLKFFRKKLKPTSWNFDSLSSWDQRNKMRSSFIGLAYLEMIHREILHQYRNIYQPTCWGGQRWRLYICDPFRVVCSPSFRDSTGTFLG